MSVPVLIVGGGLAGLSCAKHLKRPWRLVEAQGEVGGKARTFQRQGFACDVTGHWLHLRDPGITELVEALLGTELATVQRRASIHSHGVRTPYPFQANTHGLPTQVVADCLLGFFAAREAAASGAQKPPANFEDFIRQRMGDGIAEHFMLPYNQKIWTVPARHMDHGWCERFVPVPTPAEIVHGAIAPASPTSRLGYNATFRYPKTGGIGRLAAALRRSLSHEVEVGRTVSQVDWRRRSVTFADGDTTTYETLVSTMPLTDLVATLIEAPSAVVEASSRLRATTVTYWDVGLPAPNGEADAHWIYFPEASVPFYRAGSASAAVPSVAPAGHRSLYVEVSHRRGTPCPVSDADVLAGLRKVGLVGADETPVLFEKSRIDCAYVIMDQDYGAARGTILEWLTAQDIHSVGRYGAWTYDSMEGAMLQGRNIAERLDAGTSR